MSRHEGVSCDSCLKSNFRGRRYKCLICYDYDLCGACYEAGATTTRHTTDHPMQCILTRTDFDMFYGGEAFSLEQPQSFVCPFCGKMGYTETSLQEHVTAEHPDTSMEVVCPVCAALPGGDPNHVTDDFTAHLTLEHRAPRDFDEPVGSGGGIRHVRRIPHPGRSVANTRARRTNMHFQSNASSALSGLSPNTRDTTMDPIAELLSQLSSVRSRAAAAQSVSSQLQQLEMQLQSTRQQLERLPRRQAEAAKQQLPGMSAGPTAAQVVSQAATLVDIAGTSLSNANNSNANSQFLLARIGEEELTESERQAQEVEKADRGMFLQELLLSTLAEGLRLDEDSSSSSNASLSGTESDNESSHVQGAAAPPPDHHANNTGGANKNNHGNNHGNAPPPNNVLVTEKAPAHHRNMVKHLETSKKSEKEPPPHMAKQ